jgi:hypothetical protein
MAAKTGSNSTVAAQIGSTHGTAVAVGAVFIYVASIDKNDYTYQNGSYYYRTNSCNRNYEYFDASGNQYYPSNCINNNGRYYVSFGLLLAAGLLIYK